MSSIITLHYRTHLLWRVPKHSAKVILHSTKSLSSVTLGKEYSTNILSANDFLPSIFFRTLDKDFDECRKALGKL
jgi:hypothetical protein